MEVEVIRVLCPRCQQWGRAQLDLTPPQTTPGPYSCTFFVPQYEIFCGCPGSRRVEWDDLEDWVQLPAEDKPVGR